MKLTATNKGWRTVCSDCPAKGPAALSLFDAEKLAEEKGWRVYRRWYRGDWILDTVCPSCFGARLHVNWKKEKPLWASSIVNSTLLTLVHTVPFCSKSLTTTNPSAKRWSRSASQSQSRTVTIPIIILG